MLDLPRRLTVGITVDAGIDVAHVVDLGAGPGAYLELLLEHFPSARGTWNDSSQPMEELARERLARRAARVESVVAGPEPPTQLRTHRADVVLSSRALHPF